MWTGGVEIDLKLKFISISKFFPNVLLIVPQNPIQNPLTLADIFRCECRPLKSWLDRNSVNECHLWFPSHCCQLEPRAKLRINKLLVFTLHKNPSASENWKAPGEGVPAAHLAVMMENCFNSAVKLVVNDESLACEDCHFTFHCGFFKAFMSLSGGLLQHCYFCTSAFREMHEIKCFWYLFWYV